MQASTVVGYQGKSVGYALYNYMVPTFACVNGETPTLGDIGVGEGYILSSISFIDEASSATKKFEIDGVGLVDSSFVYYSAADLEAEGVVGDPGWYFLDDESVLHCVNYIEVPFGTGFYVYGAEDSALQFSGEVAEDPQPVDIGYALYNIAGNCAPTPKTLADIGVGDGYILSSISFFDEASSATKKFEIDGVGLVDSNFVYYSADDLAAEGVVGDPGWYFLDDESVLHCVNYIPLNPGDLFYVYGAEDCQIILPSYK